MRRPYERILVAIHDAQRALQTRRGRRRRKSSDTGRSATFRFETLEPRVALAAAGLVPIGAQPAGPLTGKIVYTSAGHGWQWSSTLGRYATDRGDNNEIVEDFGNQEQMTAYIDYLFRAGATIVPMRPVGRQINEVVLDNDSPGVTFSGSWSNSGSSRYYDEDYGAVADAVPYRFASTSAASETATATYTPNIPQEGFYPVYTWVLRGTDRTSQLYRVNHSGGSTEVRVDHSMVGSGWVYLGTYHFGAGSSPTSGSVAISNQGTAGKVVIADAIRFGNGMGDSTVSGGPSISGYPREDENSWHWIARSIGVGTSLATAIGSGVNNVSAPSNFARYMNADTNPFGTSVYIGFHSNAGGGRGARGLIDSDQGTPNQTALATYTGRQINQDMQALNGVFEHNWVTGVPHIFSGGFGEIDLGASAEFDATIIETAFHDSVLDAQLMRDPRVRDQLGRSTYEATLEYFDNFGGLNAPTTVPSAPINVSALSNASGQVTLSWNAGPTGVHGHAATGYRIYASTNGYGFDGGTFVAGGATNSVTLTGYDPTLPYYFKVVAVNAGGESKGSEVLAVVPNGGLRKVLIVNGFDRLERTQNFRYPYAHTGDGLVDRVWSRYNNSFDYTVQMATAIHANAPNVLVNSTSNEAVINGSVNLDNYDAVMWILGEESTSTDTFNATEQAKVTAYLAQGGKLFVSGSEIGWDLDAQGGGASFFNNVLKADYVADDANTYNVTAAPGSIFAGLSFSFSNGSQFSSLTSQTYNVDTPDRITPLGGATAALNYPSGAGAAGIQYTDAGNGSQIVMFAFPFETITTAANRAAVMDRIIDYFNLTEAPSEIEIVLDNGDGPAVYTETGVWTTSGLTGYNGGDFRFANTGAEATAQWQFTAPFSGYAEVFVQFRATANRAMEATYEIDTGDGIALATANQTINDLEWVSLGTYFFQPGQRTITLNALTSSGGNAVNADAVRIALTAGTAPDADFNADGQVDGHDFLAWQRGVGAASATSEHGDANGDGAVDGDDLAVWQEQFGGVAQLTVAASGASASAASEALVAPYDDADLVPLAQHESSLRISALAGEAAIDRPPAPSPYRYVGSWAVDGPAPGGWQPTAAAVNWAAIAPKKTAIEVPPQSLDAALESLCDWSWRAWLR
jgi:hypothetical protein